MMTKPQRGLGRGLDALFRGQQESEGGTAVQMLPIAEVRPNPEQPRQVFSEEALAELGMPQGFEAMDEEDAEFMIDLMQTLLD